MYCQSEGCERPVTFALKYLSGTRLRCCDDHAAKAVMAATLGGIRVDIERAKEADSCVGISVESPYAHDTERECGGCTACCTAMGVTSLHKNSNIRCEHQASNGCKTYQSRPGECQQYECLWLQGRLDELARPDKTGIVVSYAARNQIATETKTRILVAYVKSSLENIELAAVVDDLRSWEVLVAVSGKRRIVMGNPERVAKVADALEAITT